MENLLHIARTIFDQALADCSVDQALAHHVSVDGNTLRLGDESIDLRKLQRIRVIAVGKASRPMLGALLQRLQLPGNFDLAGVLIAPDAAPEPASQLPASPLPSGFEYFAGGHPSPNQASLDGARAALAMLGQLPQNASETTLCLFLISGGASAMMELPLDPTISLADTAAFHRALVGSGASISEINCVRKHFSAVKGGRLTQAAGHAVCRSLLISDVPIGREDALGSGPTLPDSSTLAECKAILERYHLLPSFPPAVRRFFESDKLRETPKPQDFHTQATVLLSAESLAQAAARRAESLGWMPMLVNECDEWEYKDAARYLLDRLRNLRAQHSRVCLISAGEISVSLSSNGSGHPAPGVGGRNQQFALYAATLLTPQDDPIAILSAGSDGIDGNSPAAGAVIDRSMLAGENLDSAKLALATFDAYPFLLGRNAAILTGPSGNNLRDLRLFVTGPPTQTL